MYYFNCLLVSLIHSYFTTTSCSIKVFKNMEEIPLRNISCVSMDNDEKTFGNFATIKTCNMSRNNEQRVQNRHVSFNTGSYLNSSGFEQHKYRNKPTQLSFVLWFDSLNQREKLCLVIGCITFLSFPFILLISLITTTDNDVSHSSSSTHANNTNPAVNPQPVKIRLDFCLKNFLLIQLKSKQ